MGVTTNIGSTSYTVPSQGDRGWGSSTTALLLRLATVADQVVSANITLTSDYILRDVSGSFGLKTNFVKGLGATPATDGFVRMASPHFAPGQGASFPVGTPDGVIYSYISWRNSTNSGNLHLFPNSDNVTLSFAGLTQANISGAQAFTNKTLDATNSIARLALDPGTANHVLVNNGSGEISSEATLAASRGGLATDASAFTGLVKASAGTFSAATLVNADVAAAAAIAYSKLATLTASRALVSDGSGVVSVSAVTSTELGYVSGVTSAIQTQINTKQATGNYITALTGDVVATGPGSVAATIQAGVIDNAKVAAAAAIAYSKLAALTTARALVSDGSGFVSVSAVTTTELGYVSGVTSAIQTQINGKEPTITILPIAKGGTGAGTAVAAFDNLAPTTTKGDLIVHNGSDNIRVPVGADTFILTADSLEASGVKWAASAAGFANPMTTAGDIIYGGSGGTPLRLAGAAGVLQGAVGAAPVWTAITGTGSAVFGTSPTFSTTIGVPNGSVTVPALAFTSDADGTGTGIYRVGANSLGFAANGVNIGQYSSAGAWTLGNTSTTDYRHLINGGIDVKSARSKFTCNGEPYALDLRYNSASGSAFYIGASAIHSLQFSASGGNDLGNITQAGVWSLGPTPSGSTFPGNNITGKRDGSAVAAGYVGEVLSSTLGTTSAVATTGTYKSLVSVTLTPGVWKVEGLVALNPGTATSLLRFLPAISLTNNALDVTNKGNLSVLTFTATPAQSVFSPAGRGRLVNVSANTTVYLVGYVEYSAAGTAVYSAETYIEAIRIA